MSYDQFSNHSGIICRAYSLNLPFLSTQLERSTSLPRWFNLLSRERLSDEQSQQKPIFLTSILMYLRYHRPIYFAPRCWVEQSLQNMDGKWKTMLMFNGPLMFFRIAIFMGRESQSAALSLVLALWLLSFVHLIELANIQVLSLLSSRSIRWHCAFCPPCSDCRVIAGQSTSLTTVDDSMVRIGNGPVHSTLYSSIFSSCSSSDR